MLAGDVLAQRMRPLPETESLPAKPHTTSVFTFRYPTDPTPATIRALKEAAGKDVTWRKVNGVGFEVECAVSIPSRAKSAQVLLLVEFPGRQFHSSRCAASIDGIRAPLEQRDSDGHIGYYNWTNDSRPYESEWTWYICAVDPGQHRLSFVGAAGHPSPRIGVWLWTENDLTDDAQRVDGVPCGEPALPHYRDRIERRGLCLLPPGVISSQG
jgi:hypothetical protein